MTNLPEKVVNNINAVKTVVFATVSDAGIPNVVPNQFTIVKDPETILVGDNFWHKTADNLKSQIATLPLLRGRAMKAINSRA